MTQILPIKFQEHLQVGNAFPTTFIITNHQHQHSLGKFKFEFLKHGPVFELWQISGHFFQEMLYLD